MAVCYVTVLIAQGCRLTEDVLQTILGRRWIQPGIIVGAVEDDGLPVMQLPQKTVVAVLAGRHEWHILRRRDVVAGLVIAADLGRRGQPVKLMDFRPGQVPGVATAHILPIVSQPRSNGPQSDFDPILSSA